MTAADFSLIGVTPESVGYAFAWGFSAVLGFFIAGYGAGVVLNLIRKL